MAKQRVIIGLSGGVDSSVAAYLLLQQGYDVSAMFMINWHETEGVLKGDCPWNDDLLFAELVAKKLNIPLHTVDFSVQYRKRIVNYMFNEYEQGRTPNPDVLCNREIKFDLFLNKAFEYGADFIATGHYCMKETIEVNGTPVHRLLKGTDPGKEQSYFLCQLTQKQLEHVLFPIGHLHKSEVRRIADEQGLATATRKDSQGICFVGKVDLPTFLQQQLTPRKGDVIEIPASHEMYAQDTQPDALDELSAPYIYNRACGKIIGTHNGAHFYTIGQRKGINIGGKEKPLFVIGIDTKENIIYVGQGEEHPGLYRQGLFVKTTDMHWIREDLVMQPGETKAFDIRIRYRQPLQKATMHTKAEGTYIIFDNKQRGVTPGQFAAWYKEEELLGSGIISA